MTSDHTCRTCESATTEPGNHAHYKLGLRNCAHLPIFRFVSGSHTCEKWREKTGIEKRTD